MSNQKELQFFLGSNTRRGFIPLFEQLRTPEDGYHMYILKGGPGCGKSSLMKRIAKTLEEEHGHKIEYIQCASDPNSLDAIIDYHANISLVDGTAPHTLDPVYPGAYDLIINLGDRWDEKILLQNKKKIIELTNQIKHYHSNATSYITSAAALLEINKTGAKPFVKQRTVKAFSRQMMEELKNSTIGKEKKRLLSAVSVGQIKFYENTLISLCPKLYTLSDGWGAASDYLLKMIHDYAVTNNLDMITCYCSIRTPDHIDHLIFPSAGIGITTMNSFHSITPELSEKCIPVNDLMMPIDQLTLDTLIHHLELAEQLITTAAEHIAKAKLLHDELESYYVAAMDFTKVDTIYDRIMHEILHH